MHLHSVCTLHNNQAEGLSYVINLGDVNLSSRNALRRKWGLVYWPFSMEFLYGIVELLGYNGGIAALVTERIYQKISELLKSKLGIYFFLDGIEDPYNLGYTIRSLYAAGIDGILMRQRDWHNVEGIIIKSSAGTSELIPIALVEDLETTTNFFKSKKYTVACTGKDESQSIYKSSLKPPLFVIIGGEKRGIDRTFLEKADLRLSIPYDREFAGSLPLSSVAVIIGFEILRQRNDSNE